ncbi:flippase [Methylocystis sp. H62]|uniref:flippase n=1 Tax=Methylocystis sp. H62 TaxID=2785789 RepID=UPI0018C2C5A8|nr:flippase [Methylocystis sp. H62]MBG0792625.1 flippase [Methylocystis sp. H62]
MSAAKHTGYNLLGALIPISVSLLTTPIYIRLIGEARYGVLAIVWSLLGYFGVFDLGLGRATSQRIAALGNSSPQLISSTFWTALAMNAALGSFGGMLIWPVANYYFRYTISLGSDLRSELWPALPWLMFAVPLTTMSGVVGGALQGRAQFLELNVISVTSTVLVQTLPLIVAWGFGPDLALLLPAVILIKFFTFIAGFWRCKIHVFRDQAPLLACSDAKSLLRFGGWVTISSLIDPLMSILDRFVIGAKVSASAVTYYSVPFQLGERSLVLSVAITSALFPRFATANAIEREQLAKIALRSLVAVTTPVMVVAVLLVEPFLGFWISPEFAANANGTAQILLLGFWINGVAAVPFAQLQGAGRPDVTAKFHMAELLPYLIALFVGLYIWGLPGAAAAFSLRVVGDCVLLLWFAEMLPSEVATLRVPALLLLGALGSAIGWTFCSTMWWLAAVSLSVVALGWSLWCAPAEMRELAIGVLKKLLASMREALR